MKRLLFVLLLSAATGLQAAVQVEGVKFDDHARVGAADTVLNGAGVRNKLWFKVYVVGLYLPARTASAADAVALKGAKRLHLVALRDLTAEQLADALVKGVEHNSTDAEMAKLRGRLDELKAAMLSAKDAPKGANIFIDWTPEAGTRLVLDGKPLGKDIAGEDLYRGVLRIWLGSHPAQDNLKEALLGRPQ